MKKAKVVTVIADDGAEQVFDIKEIGKKRAVSEKTWRRELAKVYGGMQTATIVW